MITSSESSSQTDELYESIRSQAARPTPSPNGRHASVSNQAVASSSKNKLDVPPAAPYDDASTSKRKASATPLPMREEKRSKRGEEAVKAPNGIHRDEQDDDDDETLPATTTKNGKHPTSPKAGKQPLPAKGKGVDKAASSKKGGKKKKKAVAAVATGGDDDEEDGAAASDQSPAPPTSAKKTGNGAGKKGAATQAVAQLPAKAKGKEVASEDIVTLLGHSAEVFSSAWNPSVPGLIASAGGDATVRIWDLPSSGSTSPDSPPAVCKHLPTTNAKDVSALEWNPDGTLLASGSYDGILRLWTPQGDLHLVMSMHQGPIFAVRWNRKGTMLLTSSADGTAIVWDLSSGKVRQQFPIHSDSILDVDWLVSTRSAGPASRANEATFATGSADNSINICRVGEPKPVRTLRGHDDEVNAIRFDASQTLLASASDDCTAKIWSVAGGASSTATGSSAGASSSTRKRSSRGRSGADSSMEVDRSDDEGGAAADASVDGDVDSVLRQGNNGSHSSGGSPGCLFTLTGHTKELYALAWAPTGPGSTNPEQPRMLATTSFDKTARIWNADDGTCLRVIDDHVDSVYAICWSPDARFLATGGIDARVFVTRCMDGEIVKAFVAGGAVFDVSWHVAQEGQEGEEGKEGKAVIKDEHDEAAGGVNGSSYSSKRRLSAMANARHQLAVSQQNRTLSVLDLGKLLEASPAALPPPDAAAPAASTAGEASTQPPTAGSEQQQASSTEAPVSAA